jgi:hypothetical protein
VIPPDHASLRRADSAQGGRAWTTDARCAGMRERCASRMDDRCAMRGDARAMRVAHGQPMRDARGCASDARRAWTTECRLADLWPLPLGPHWAQHYLAHDLDSLAPDQEDQP